MAEYERTRLGDLSVINTDLLKQALEMNERIKDSSVRPFAIGATYVALLVSDALEDEEVASLAHHIGSTVQHLGNHPLIDQ